MSMPYSSGVDSQNIPSQDYNPVTLPAYSNKNAELTNPLLQGLKPQDLTRLLGRMNENNEKINLSNQKINADSLKGLYNEQLMPLNYTQNYNAFDFTKNFSEEFMKKYLLHAIKGTINASSALVDPKNPAGVFQMENHVSRWFKEQAYTLFKEKDTKLAELIKDDNFDSLPWIYIISKKHPEYFNSTDDLIELNRSLMPKLTLNEIKYITDIGINPLTSRMLSELGPINHLKAPGSSLEELIGLFASIYGKADPKLLKIGERTNEKMQRIDPIDINLPTNEHARLR